MHPGVYKYGFDGQGCRDSLDAGGFRCGCVVVGHKGQSAEDARRMARTGFMTAGY